MVWEYVLIFLGAFIMVVGLIGCVVPVIPGPPISYVGILILHFTEKVQFSSTFLLIWAFIAIAVTVIDNIVPVWGTRKTGGSKWGVWGSAIGLIIGIFFAPIGIFIGPFLGALFGELMFQHTQEGKSDKVEMDSNKKTKRAFIAALGSFLGLMVGIVLKLVVSFYLTFRFVKALFV